MAYLEDQDGEILEKVELTTTQPCRDKLKWFTVNGTFWYCEKVKTRGWNQITGRPNIQKRYNDTKQVTDCPHTWKRNYSKGKCCTCYINDLRKDKKNHGVPTYRQTQYLEGMRQTCYFIRLQKIILPMTCVKILAHQYGYQ